MYFVTACEGESKGSARVSSETRARVLTCEILSHSRFALMKTSLYWVKLSSITSLLSDSPSQMSCIRCSVWSKKDRVSEGPKRKGARQGATDLASKMRLAEGPVEPDEIPSLDESDPERRGREILGVPLLLFHHILSLDDGGDVLGDRSVGSCDAGEQFSSKARDRAGTD